jgi:transposase-like protein
MDKQLTILKRDDLGRVQSTAESRAEAVAEYQRSGLSATAFAKMAGIAPNTFWNWLHAQGLTQKRPRALAGASKPVRFIQGKRGHCAKINTDKEETRRTIKMRVRTWKPYEAAQRVRTPRGRAWSQAAGSESCVVSREAGTKR